MKVDEIVAADSSKSLSMIKNVLNQIGKNFDDVGNAVFMIDFVFEILVMEEIFILASE